MAKVNRAIILAVSDYQQAVSLPACKKDGAIVKSILRETGKFTPENTLYIDTDTTSGKVKGELARFVKEAAQQETGELFFYYTGHGLFNGLEFYYLFTDYNETKLQQTALSNSELDEMLRSLKADLTVKVIDACQSAQQYVKSPEEFEKTLKATGPTYNNCYFLFSSEQMQSSWQDSNLSYFTAEFARSIERHTSQTIRYKDIIDFVSDAFSGNTKQRPVFVIQANFTEVFCEVTDTLRQAIATLLQANTGVQVAMAGTGVGSSELALSITGSTLNVPDAPALRLPLNDVLKERVRKEAGIYCTEAEAMKAIQAMKGAIDAYVFSDPLHDFYTLKFDYTKEIYNIPNKESIGNWLKTNSHTYFATTIYRDESYETEELVRDRYPFLDISPRYKTVTRQRPVIDGFDTTTELPFKSIHCLAEPMVQHLPWWAWYCAIIVSKSSIRCFYSYTRLKEINWNKRKQTEGIEWRTEEFPMKVEELIRKSTCRLLDSFAAAIMAYMLEKYQLEGDTSG